MIISYGGWKKRVVGSGAISLVAYLIVNVLLIVTNPPQYVTNNVDFLGAPIGDLSDDIRLYLTEQVTNGLFESNVTWVPDEDICRFSYGWNTEDGLLGNYYNQAFSLCENTLIVDYYSLEGINILSPYGAGVVCPSIDDLINDTDTYGVIVPDIGPPYTVLALDDDVSVRGTYVFCSLENVDFADDIENREAWVDNRETLDFFELRHTYHFTTDLEKLGLPEGSSIFDVKVLFQISRVSGAYEIADTSIDCDEPSTIHPFEVECTYSFRFFPGSVEFNVINSDVRYEILQELDAIVNDTHILPGNLSVSGMEQLLREQLSDGGELVDFDIKCVAAYPYPSSTCYGEYELRIPDDIYNSGIIISVMTVYILVLVTLLSTLRLGMLNRRSSRGYLGAGGSCQYFFEGDEQKLNQSNTIPSIALVRINTDGSITRTPDCIDMEEPGSSVPKENSIPRMRSGKVNTVDGNPSCLGIIVSDGVEKIPVDTFTLPICFIVMENVDESITNVDMEEAHKLIDTSCGRTLLDESFGGEHLTWAREFSVVDAGGCLLTLWTVHFLASNSGWGSFYWVAALVAIARWLEESDVMSVIGLFKNTVPVIPKKRHSVAPPLPITLAVMEVLYDLEIPGMNVIGLVFTCTWSLFIVISCVYFIYVLGYEPIYTGGGLVSTKVSLTTAISVCTTMGTPLALAGDWVRKTRGGDIGGRLAFPLCLGMPISRDNTKISRVSHHSELHPTSLATSVICG